jgi:hypothetical protein
VAILKEKVQEERALFEHIFYLDKSVEAIIVAVVAVIVVIIIIIMRKNSLLSSLVLLVNIYQLNHVTAFIIDNAARTTRLLHCQSGLDLNFINNNNNNNNNNNRNDEDARWKSSSLTRLHATSSFDEQSNNHNSNSNKNKRTTALNAATGMSLPTTLLLDDDSSSDTSNDMGVGVLFLNLGGPKTGDDVEGTLR